MVHSVFTFVPPNVFASRFPQKDLDHYRTASEYRRKKFTLPEQSTSSLVCKLAELDTAEHKGKA